MSKVENVLWCTLLSQSYTWIVILLLGMFASDCLSQNCGTERWNIKTLSDKDTVKIDFNNIFQTRVSIQAALKRPAASIINRLDSETSVLSINCSIIGYKRSLEDKDIHIIIEDVETDATMVIEIPSHECVEIQKTSRYILFKKLEEWFIHNIGYPHHYFTFLQNHIPVTITGVGFFDSHHGQIGMAGNGREIHPVLSIAFR